MVVDIETISPERMVNGKIPALFTIRFADVHALSTPIPRIDTGTTQPLTAFFDNRQFKSRIIKVQNSDTNQPETVYKMDKKKKLKKKKAEDTATDVWIY